ncbi:nucleotide exchange factor GrpE [Patescibacteria group bacterium]|nr:nucleotide exchange factor GrpE [Patescibacteria group bacterium]MBU1952657.1 nucleotide exchange factor GrpE [Patescibacteria group bacterium]
MKEKDKLERYHKQIKEFGQKVSDLESNWKRALADYKNLEKRIAEDKEQLVFYVKKQTVEEFLPFLDNLEKIEKHIKDKGLELTLREFRKTLISMGVQEVEAEGKEFDHETMEAVETKKGEKNKVLKTILRGYLLNGKLLRPAKVIVGQE